MKLLTANVGNADFMNCGSNYFFKLCLLEWEEPLKKSIKELQPDIVSLQEVLDIIWCEQGPEEKDIRKVCYRYTEQEELHQVRRLLGPEYTIVCDGRSHFECIGIKESLGEVIGCPMGEICRDRGSLTHGAPEECDQKPVVFGVDVEIRGEIIRVVNGHPAAGNESCRAEEVRRMFEGYESVPPLAVSDRNTIAMGDMNLDPFRDNPESPDIAIWNEYVGPGKQFRYLSGPTENDPPHVTAAGRTIDHVITNFASGGCNTLGVAEGTSRLDRVVSEQQLLEANDHHAIFCNLVFSVEQPVIPSFEEVFPSEILEPDMGFPD